MSSISFTDLNKSIGDSFPERDKTAFSSCGELANPGLSELLNHFIPGSLTSFHVEDNGKFKVELEKEIKASVKIEGKDITLIYQKVITGKFATGSGVEFDKGCIKGSYFLFKASLLHLKVTQDQQRVSGKFDLLIKQHEEVINIDEAIAIGKTVQWKK